MMAATDSRRDERSVLLDNRQPEVAIDEPSGCQSEWCRKRRGVIIAASIGTAIAVILATIIILVINGNIFLPLPNAPSVEERFLSAVRPDNIQKIMKEFSAVPHLAGTEHDRQQAYRVQELFTNWGLSSKVEEIPVMLQYPTNRYVGVTSPPELKYDCLLEEAVVDDGTSGVPGAIPPWNGWSGAGDVEGELIYANYGQESDFDALKEVNFTGKIVIVRYGAIFRANKVLFAMQRGAAAVLMFVDPADTGYLKGPVYPEGPWSTNSTTPRGTAWIGNGDPTTPGWPSTPGGPRISLQKALYPPPGAEMPALPTIPVQPLSYGDAFHLLRGLQGRPVPSSSWAGGFNLTHIGPGPVRVRVTIGVNYTVTPIWNTIATIRGATSPDQYVILGGHRDAWTFGAGDPISGTAMLLEVARGLGDLVRSGWQPARSIIICSWDAEEYGLIGSIEFVERYLPSLTARAVAYFNVDIAVSGTDTISFQGTPSLFPFVESAAKSVRVSCASNASSPERTLWDLFDGQWGYPDDGSDHSPFAHHAGIPTMIAQMHSLDGRYASVYHSNYDSYFWYMHFGDPTFQFHTAMAQLYGLFAIRSAADTILPPRFVKYAVTIETEIETLATNTQLDVTAMRRATWQMLNASKALEAALATQLPAHILASLNRKLLLAERCFLDDRLSGRPWYRHVLWTPSPTNSYAGSAFFSIYSASAQGDHNRAQFLADRIAQVIEAAADFLNPDEPMLG